jgi:hypothetical protein
LESAGRSDDKFGVILQNQFPGYFNLYKRTFGVIVHVDIIKVNNFVDHSGHSGRRALAEAPRPNTVVVPAFPCAAGATNVGVGLTCSQRRRPGY